MGHLTTADGKQVLLATDMDGTVFDNRKGIDPCPYAGKIMPGDVTSMTFKEMAHADGVVPFPVTGRNIRELDEGLRHYGFDDLNLPYAAVDTGLHVYERVGGSWRFDSTFNNMVSQQVASLNWDKKALMGMLGSFASSVVSPTQDIETQSSESLKVQWTVHDTSKVNELVHCVREAIERHGMMNAAVVVGSIDPAKAKGFIDVMPLYRFEDDPSNPVTGKVIGIEYVRRKLGLNKEQVLYAGDSGNDFHALIGGYRGTLVGNASEAVRARLQQEAREKQISELLHFPEGKWRKFDNGHCLRGKIRGMCEHGVFDPDVLFENGLTVFDPN
jgi:hydroxymethylpyrimidine pyrophosphatase-like HAD family hydrolase